MSEPRRIPITDAKTGEVRYSDPQPQQGQRKNQQVGSLPASSAERTQPEPLQGYGGPEAPTVPTGAPAPAALVSAGAGEPRASAKPKVEIETFGQFIAQAYGMKGRKVAMKGKVERAIAQDPKLTFDEMERVGQLVKEDAVLAVPRQLLLAARSVQGFPALRAALREFVRDVLLCHPFFSQLGVEAALRNLDHAPSPAEVLKMLAASEKQLLDVIADEKELGPETELQDEDIRQHLVVWLNELNPKQREVLARRFGLLGYEPSTLEDVGHEIGLTRERVRQIQVEALRRLREIVTHQGLNIETLFQE